MGPTVSPCLSIEKKLSLAERTVTEFETGELEYSYDSGLMVMARCCISGSSRRFEATCHLVKSFMDHVPLIGITGYLPCRVSVAYCKTSTTGSGLVQICQQWTLHVGVYTVEYRTSVATCISQVGGGGGNFNEKFYVNPHSTRAIQ